MEKQVLQSMFDNLLHIGNKINFWDPKMKNYIYGSTNGIHVFNLVKTAEKIEEVKVALNELTKSGKKVLFVATKLQARDSFKNLAIETGSFYVTEKWVPGLLTNFKTIRKRIGTYLKLLKDQELGEFDSLTKKEKATRLLELEKLDKAYGGLKEMKKIPDIIFVVDGAYEKQALKEANTLGLTTLAVLNTNGNDLVVTNCIPANTNSVKSLQYIASALKSSVVAGVSAPVSTEAKKIQKIGPVKVSGEKTIPKKLAFKKQENTTEENVAVVESPVLNEKTENNA